MEQQEETNWCWAAVAASIHKFLNPTNPLAQGEIATGVLNNGVNCSATPDLCNYPGSLYAALNFTGNFRQFAASKRISFDNIRNWINAGLPVAVRIAWYGVGAHFVVIDGYRVLQSGELQVQVQDPDQGFSIHSYDDFAQNYPPGGYWLDTYTVKR
jgi:hypothetical protein